VVGAGGTVGRPGHNKIKTLGSVYEFLAAS
jgi:hypothetical protein